jgi:multisubunit Na+/H+ antiporter MnhB subunit
MKNVISNFAKGLLFVPAFAMVLGFAAVPFAQPANASIVDEGIDAGAGAAKSEDQGTDLFGDGGIFRTITNVLLFLIGAVSVIMLIIGGIRYTISGGDSTAVTSAKNTILYAVIGIVVALLAYAIVNFVLDSFQAGA